jgi:hypothetical protein
VRFNGAVERDPAIDAWMKEQGGLGAIAHQWSEVMRKCGDDAAETATALDGPVFGGWVKTFGQPGLLAQSRAESVFPPRLAVACRPLATVTRFHLLVGLSSQTFLTSSASSNACIIGAGWESVRNKSSTRLETPNLSKIFNR